MLTQRTFTISSLIIFIAVICSTTIAATTKQKEENKIVLEYEFSEPVVSKWQAYDLVQMEGLESYERTGAPIVPVRPVTVLIPFGKKVVSTKAIVLDKKELPGTYILAPAQKPYPMNYVGPKVQTEPDETIYGLDAPWPGVDHKQMGTGSKRGYQLLTLILFPVQYKPKSGEIKYATKIRLEIELADSAAKGVLRPTEKTRQALKKTVENPDTLSSYEAEAMSAEMEMLAGEESLLSGGPYQYVIITSQELADMNSSQWTFQTLRDNRITHGLSATIVATEWIYENYDANEFDPNSYDASDPNASTNLATEIRMFLRDAYLDWQTEYVLLGGDSSIIPVRYLSFPYFPDYEYTPADVYYGCVDPEETFNGDGDEYYGEINDGIDGNDVDLHAEIYVGRAAVENAAEMVNFVRKTLTYDATYDDVYHPRITMLGGHLDIGSVEYAKPLLEQIRLGGYYDGYFTYGFENQTHPYFYDFDTSVNLYDADETWYRWDVYPLMNGGTHVFNDLCHSLETLCMKMGTTQLQSEVHNDDYFFVYSQGCLPGAFDTPNCFAEVITTMEHGAFAVIMNSRSAHLSGTQRFNRYFWDAVLGKQRILEVGRALQAGKEANIWDVGNIGGATRYTYFELNLFGDPAQQFKFPYVPSAGYLLLDDEYYACDSNVAVLLIDHDLQCNGTQEVNFVTSGGDIETCILDEEVPTYGIFRGIMSTEAAEPVQQDGLLQVFDGQTITVIYNDANDGTGNPATADETAAIDCTGPTIFNVDFEQEFTGLMLTLSFETDEPATVRIECGTSCGAADIVVEEDELLTNHAINVYVPQTGEYYFTIEATDYVGNSTVDSNDDNCYRFTSLPGPITVPDDYPTIASAIASIPEFGTGEIIVKPGTYYESLEVKDKIITLYGTDPNDWDVVEATIINGNIVEDTLYFNNASNSRLNGLTIAGGRTGIRCYVSESLEIKNCIVENNKGGVSLGGGCYGTSIENCIIRNNGNRAVSLGYASLTLKNSLIYGNNGGVYNELSSVTIRNCTIAYNNSFGVKKGSYGSASISNCILWNNGDDLSGYKATYSCIKDCNDVGDPNSTHNICDDPCFVPDDEYYHLQPDSPCINKGKQGTYTGELDIDGDPRVQAGRVDIGADEAPPRVHNVTRNLWYVYIQDAIDEAIDDDEIVAYPGEYYESVDFKGKDIVVRSLDPCDCNVVEDTVINSNGAQSAVQFRTYGPGYPHDKNLIDGFTITGGTYGVWFKDGITAAASNCIIRDNQTGVRFQSATGTITNCTIKENSSEAISIESANANILNSIIRDNNVGVSVSYAGVHLYNSIIADNDGSGVTMVEFSTAYIHNCTIVNNDGDGVGAGYYTSAEISNCILWNNGDDLSGFSATYSCIKNCEDADGTGNICGDANAPLFADTEYYHLQPGSPCINAGDPNGDYEGQVDIDGEARIMAGRVDMGVDETLRIYNENKEKWYVTVNEAAEDANEHDTIVIYSGTYYESLDMSDYTLPPYGYPKDITIRGADPNDWDVVSSTVIDGNEATNTIVMSYGTNSLLTGLTVTGGVRGISGSTSIVKNCIIRDNSGDGVYFSAGNGTLTNCIIKDNANSGIFMTSGGHTVKNSLFYDNDTGVTVHQYCSPTVSNCTIVDNTSYGVKRSSPYSSVTISNCILWDNGDDLFDCSATYSCIEDGNDCGQNGNICAEPYFIPDDEYYHLLPDSPCIDAGDPNGDYEGQEDIDNGIRVFGIDVDMGADETTYPDGHWWKLDETSGVTAYDSIDDDDGTFSSSDPCWVEGIIGGAIECNGVSDYFSISSLNSEYCPYYNTRFSVAGWFKTEQSSGMQTIVGNWNQYGFVAYPDQHISMYFGWQVLVENNKVVARFGPAGNVNDITGSVDVNDGQWHHFTLVFASLFSDSSLYVDGQLDATPQTIHGILSNTQFRIGDGSYVSSGEPVIKGGPFNGTIDDIMLFDRVLTADEAVQLYENGL